MTKTDGQASEQDSDEDEHKMDGWREKIKEKFKKKKRGKGGGTNVKDRSEKMKIREGVTWKEGGMINGKEGGGGGRRDQAREERRRVRGGRGERDVWEEEVVVREKTVKRSGIKGRVEEREYLKGGRQRTQSCRWTQLCLHHRAQRNRTDLFFFF